MGKRLLLGLILLSGVGEAALPPAWEAVREIKAILDDNQLNHYLDSGEIVNKIERTEEGWAIQTNRSRISITVKTLPQSVPAPPTLSSTSQRLLKKRNSNLP